MGPVQHIKKIIKKASLEGLLVRLTSKEEIQKVVEYNIPKGSVKKEPQLSTFHGSPETIHTSLNMGTSVRLGTSVGTSGLTW